MEKDEDEKEETLHPAVIALIEHERFVAEVKELCDRTFGHHDHTFYTARDGFP